MIVEGIVTTMDEGDGVNVAPMGPLTDPEHRRLVFRPFTTSTTYRNLKRHPEGVFHVTDDVELIAHSCVGAVVPAFVEARAVRGRVIADACEVFEFRVHDLDDREERTRIEVDIVHRETRRPFFGFNRAKHAVVEAAILASRIGILPAGEILDGFARLEAPVRKTAGEAETRAFEFLKAHVDRALNESTLRDSVRVCTGSRLHFGLLAPWDAAGRRHGGVGMMVDRPRLELEARLAPETSVRGPLARRVEEVLSSLESDGRVSSGIEVEVISAPPEHSGLGAGTQLSLATARAVSELLGRPTADACELARWTSRGKRSAIGTHGFAVGGFLVDGGHATALPADGPGGSSPSSPLQSGIAPLLARFEVPESWRVLIAIPPRERGLSGGAERDAFEKLDARGDAGLARRDELCRRVLLSLLPAVAECDFVSFSRALWELQVRVGEIFAEVQGGVFASDRVEALISYLRKTGIEGVGQSSWGPAVFAFVQDPQRATGLATDIATRFDLAPSDIVVARALNSGARCERRR